MDGGRCRQAIVLYSTILLIGCENPTSTGINTGSTIDTLFVINRDTLVIRDTVYSHRIDSSFVFDTVIFKDTIYSFDTLHIYDTVFTGTVNPWIDSRDYSSLAECVNSSATEGKTILIAAPLTTNTLTIPSDRNVQFVNGGTIIVADSQTLTINGTLDAPLIQIFDGNGRVQFGNGTVFQIFPQWFGAKGDGSHDDADAIQRAIDSREGGFTTVFFPSGSYYCTKTISIRNDRTHLAGNGVYSTTFYFNPSVSEILFDFAGPTPETTIHSCSLRDVGLIGMGTNRKIALRLVNTSELLVENISVFSSWSGSGSIGILMQGRELTTIRRITVFADNPIVIEDNPSNGPEGTIDSDHLRMEDLYLGPQMPGKACIYIASGVNLTNFVLNGTNSFVTAKYGIFWNDTSTIWTSNNMSIKNIRIEQSSDSTGYAVYISHNYALQNLLLENVSSDISTNGFYFRKCKWITMINCVVPASGRVALDADNSQYGDQISIINSFFQEGSTVAK